MRTNWFNCSTVKTFKTIIFAPICFGLHKPPSGTYSLRFVKVTILNALYKSLLKCSVLLQHILFSPVVLVCYALCILLRWQRSLVPMWCVAPLVTNEGNSLEQGYNRPTGCSAEMAPHATFISLYSSNQSLVPLYRTLFFRFSE